MKQTSRAGGSPATPGKKRPGAVGKRTRATKYDDFTLSCVRRKVHTFFRRNEIPTVQKLLIELNQESDVFPNKISRWTLQRLLKDIGFKFRTRSRNAALIERSDIILWRRRYLRDIKRYRDEKRPVYFLDETWVNAGHTKTKTWQDTTIHSARQAWNENLTSGLKEPSGKGGRLILTHAGSTDGFVKGAENLFGGKKKSADYHDEMDGNRFERWFESKLLPNIKPKSVIVMDNAPYHSVLAEKTPNKSWIKAEIQEWLTNKKIDWSPDMLKLELLDLVGKVKAKYRHFKVDLIAKAAGHDILRIPPYHCELNPIELIWSQIKGYVAARNTTFKLNDVHKLFLEGIKKVSTDDWKKSVQHVVRKEEELWELDGLMEDVTQSQELIINLEESDSDENCFSEHSEVMSGVEEIQW